jgi:hypothetical protein
MKSFFRFLTEARQSQASMQAKKLGLTGDGHGGWIDRAGKVIARTEDGKLKFTEKRTPKDKKNQKQILKNLLLLLLNRKQKHHQLLNQP